MKLKNVIEVFIEGGRIMWSSKLVYHFRTIDVITLIQNIISSLLQFNSPIDLHRAQHDEIELQLYFPLKSLKPYLRLVAK